MNPKERKAQMLEAGLLLAKKTSYAKVTRDAIAREIGVSVPLVSTYFGTSTNMRREIMRAAISREIVEIVAQGLADRNAHAMKAPDALKQKAAAYLVA